MRVGEEVSGAGRAERELNMTMKRHCICEICKCGRHRCPSEPTALYSKGSTTDMVSEYIDKYPGYDGCQTSKSFKPECEYKGFKGKMDATTTVMSDYVPYEVGARPARKVAQYLPQPGNIDLGTTYKTDYFAYRVDRVAPMIPKSRGPIATGKIKTLSTYKDNYRKWEQSRRELIKPDLSFHPPNVKFGNKTTCHEDYVPKKPIPQASFKPLDSTKMSDAAFSGLTTTNMSYVPHELPPRFFKTPEVYKPCSQPFQDFTTYRICHTGQVGSKSLSFKPKQGKVGSDIPLQCSTEFSDRYKEWPVTVPQAHKAAAYLLPTEKMDLNTTTNITYTKYNVPPSKPVVQRGNLGLSAAPFHDLTTMKEDFRLWDSKRREPIVNLDEMPKAAGKMEHVSTFRAHFVPKSFQPVVSFKPLPPPIRTDVRMDKNTTYRTEFVPKKCILCPASFEKPPGYVFEEVNDKGHRIYREEGQEKANTMWKDE